MAVEILILSGARQGERLVLSATEFRAGAEPDCAVYFDPRVDAGAAGRSVCFRLLEDGWYATAAGSVLINQQVIAGPTRIRSGDIVRMSERGPDFSFSIVARAAAPAITPVKAPWETRYPPAAASPLSAVPAGSGPPQGAPSGPGPAALSPGAPAPLAPVAPLLASQAASGSAHPRASASPWGAMPGPQASSTAAATPAPVVPIPAAPSATPPSPAAKSGAKERWLLAVGGGVVICVLLVLLFRPTVIVLRNGEGTTPAPVVPNPTPPNPTQPTPTSPTPPPQKPTPPPEAPPLVSKADQITAQLQDAVYLVQAESSDRFWCFAACCAVGEHTLLTSAQEACQLIKWQEDPQLGFKFWVTSPSRNVRMPLEDIRVHAVFLTTLAGKEKREDMYLTDDQGDPRDLLYFDLALLSVAEKLPKIVALASPKELDEGLPLYCLGFTHAGEKVTKYDRLELQATPAKVDLITPWPTPELQARLLHLTGKIPKHAYGGALVSEAGKVVAVYGANSRERDVGEPAGQSQKELHYAPWVNPEWIDLGLNQKDSKMWLVKGIRKRAADSQENR